jgi:hypothetical protein
MVPIRSPWGHNTKMSTPQGVPFLFMIPRVDLPEAGLRENRKTERNEV